MAAIERVEALDNRQLQTNVWNLMIFKRWVRWRYGAVPKLENEQVCVSRLLGDDSCCRPDIRSPRRPGHVCLPPGSFDSRIWTVNGQPVAYVSQTPYWLMNSKPKWSEAYRFAREHGLDLLIDRRRAFGGPTTKARPGDCVLVVYSIPPSRWAERGEAK